jgi:hypothetical protein
MRETPNNVQVWGECRSHVERGAHNCTSEGTGSIQPHRHWSTGLLVDSCNIPDGRIDLINRHSSGSGHGWAIGWGIAWNCGMAEENDAQHRHEVLAGRQAGVGAELVGGFPQVLSQLTEILHARPFFAGAACGHAFRWYVCPGNHVAAKHNSPSEARSRKAFRWPNLRAFGLFGGSLNETEILAPKRDNAVTRGEARPNVESRRARPVARLRCEKVRGITR